MTTFKKRPLCSLRFASAGTYEENLSYLCSLIERTPDDAVVIAPEVCLTNFDYDHFEEAADFASTALESLSPLSQSRIIVLTVIERRAEGIYNVAKVLHGNEVVHEQAKARLFKFGGEHEYFAEGCDEEIVLFEVDGLKMGIMICFELRFKALWQKLEGADIIAVPAQWGILRSEHFVTLTEALAVMNQCYVVASDSANPEMTGQSGIISPFGEVRRNGNIPCLEGLYDEKEVQKMRRYLDVGINAR
ncbi:MAG: carbon-nitrogen hydrolase family protein [Sulfurimonadaceae bacterium]|nr:carbon-nitrogen hydrolase family protein [Sulfurimonadaceae bacterium]